MTDLSISSTAYANAYLKKKVDILIVESWRKISLTRFLFSELSLIFVFTPETFTIVCTLDKKSLREDNSSIVWFY